MGNKKTGLQRLIIVGLLCACSSQSEQEGFQVLCSAPAQCPECTSASEQQPGQQLDGWIQRHVSNTEVLSFYKQTAFFEPEQKIDKWRTRVKAAGVPSCEYVDWLSARHAKSP